VINFEIPFSTEDYIHRIGRTGRSSFEGIAFTFVSTQENKKWDRLYKQLQENVRIEKTSFYSGSSQIKSNAGQKFRRRPKKKNRR